MKHSINQEEQNQIRQAIEAFERKSGAEIVTIIAKESDRYLYIPTLYAAFAALVASWLVSWGTGPLGTTVLVELQLLLFAVFALMVHITPLKMALIPSAVKKKRCAMAAQSYFFNAGLHNTSNRAGVMLFVSEAEKYVEIIADVAAAQKIPNSIWEEAVHHFIECVQEGKTAQGYLETIERIGGVLAEHFPHAKDDKDELPNHLIVVE